MEACLVDSHVHLYPQFPPQEFLDAAAANAARAGRALNLPAGTPGLLLLTQTHGEPAVPEVLDRASGWTVDPTGEAISTRVSAPGKPELYLVQGWQVVSAEGLEVLGLGMAAPPPSGAPVAETVASVTAAGGRAVLPWGVGKWRGAREALIREIAGDAARFPDVAFGDIAGRPGFLRTPEIFAHIAAQGRRILPGTDPLPFAGDVAKVARLVFRAGFDRDAPFRSLSTWLRTAPQMLETGGEYERILPFLRLQIAMQIRKRLR